MCLFIMYIANRLYVYVVASVFFSIWVYLRFVVVRERDANAIGFNFLLFCFCMMIVLSLKEDVFVDIIVFRFGS